MFEEFEKSTSVLLAGEISDMDNPILNDYFM
jgi:hypothetical protein